MKPEFNQFKTLAQKYDVIPVARKIVADFQTPVSILDRFTDDSEVFLLESVETGERFGRYSFLGINPKKKFILENSVPVLIEKDGTRRVLNQFHSDCSETESETPSLHEGNREKNRKMSNADSLKNPLEALFTEVCSAKTAPLENAPPLIGGAVGYIGYDCVEFFEPVRLTQKNNGLPRSIFLITDEIILFDNFHRTVQIIVSVCPDEFDSTESAYRYAIERIDDIQKKMNSQTSTPINDSNASSQANCQSASQSQSNGSVVKIEPKSEMTRTEFCSRVNRIKEKIVAGDIIQAVLSQRFFCPQTSDSFQLYRALRMINPSPYTFFLKLKEITLIGSSPETLVKLENGSSILRPIAGTRKRGKTPEEDRQFAEDLLQDEKERAEHLMLVDLGRNDLGRTAQKGSVHLNRFMTVERFSHVMHLTSEIEARLDPSQTAIDLLKTTFPAGTLSGAPKIRAIEIIDELEPAPRDVYGGAVGYLDRNGNMDFAIAIRTMECSNNRIKIQAGAGIVYDSDPESEYMETVNKAKAVFQAVQLAADNFDLKNE